MEMANGRTNVMEHKKLKNDDRVTEYRQHQKYTRNTERTIQLQILTSLLTSPFTGHDVHNSLRSLLILDGLQLQEQKIWLLALTDEQMNDTLRGERRAECQNIRLHKFLHVMMVGTYFFFLPLDLRATRSLDLRCEVTRIKK